MIDFTLMSDIVLRIMPHDIDLSHLSDVDKAERVLKGHCEICFREPGEHNTTCANSPYITYNVHVTKIRYTHIGDTVS